LLFSLHRARGLDRLDEVVRVEICRLLAAGALGLQDIADVFFRFQAEEHTYVKNVAA